ncbi:MAG TPA: 6-bladed beta-propeller, partial [Bacteroidales bacterium]|nr:6-bladed beta-propeller [Bacteroidales bacterium]
MEEDLVITDEAFISNSLRLEVRANSEGELLVANLDLNSIYLFSKDGKKLKQISRQGRGPGEFISLGDIFMDVKDNLYALDRNYGKVTVFSPPNYEVSDELPIKPRLNNQRPEYLFITNDGDYLIAYSEILSINNSENKDNTLYSIDTSRGYVKNTVLKYTDDQIFVYANENRISTMSVPYGYKSILKIGPDGNLFWGKTNRGNIKIFNEKGIQINSIKIDHDPVQIPSKNLQTYKDIASANDPFAEVTKKLLESGKIPEVYP